jgi:tetratricopeptide (TPR) repeat protein
MIWSSLLRPFDRRVVFSAPVLVLFVGLLALAALGFEMSKGRAVSKAIEYTISSGIEAVENEISDPQLPQEIRQEISDLVAQKDQLDASSVLIDSVVNSQKPGDLTRDQVLCEIGKELARKKRHEEAVVFFALLSPDQLQQFDCTFAYARSLSELNKTEDAIAVYEFHVSINPTHQAGFINLGLLLSRMERHDEAVTVLGQAAGVSSGSRRGKALALKGDSLLALGRVEDSMSTYRSSIDYRPNSGLTWRKLAIAMWQAPLSDPQDVEEIFQKADALSPGSAKTLVAWAEFYFSRGRFDEALQPYRKAMQASPNDFDILTDRILNLISSGRPKAALRLLNTQKENKRSKRQRATIGALHAVLSGGKRNVEKAEKKLANYASSDQNLHLLTLLDVRKKDIEGALKRFEGHSENSSYLVASRFAVAQLRLRDNQVAQAVIEFGQLANQNQRAPLLQLFYGRALVRSGDQANSLSYFETAHSLHTDSRKITREYAETLRRVGNYAIAEKVLVTYLAFRSKDVRVLRDLALTFEEQGKMENAIETYSQLLSAEPDDLEAGVKLSQLFADQGDFNNSLTTINEVVDRDFGNVQIRLRKTEILIAAKRYGDASVELENVLRLDPENEYAIELKANLSNRAS